MENNFWNKKQVAVLGGASFIASHLTERLVELEAKVVIADNFSTGKLKYLKKVEDNIVIHECDLRNPKQTIDVLRGKEYVFHLAAVHGGREFISKYPADCCQSLQINENVLRQCVEAKIKKIIFSSSVCVYPKIIQVKGETPVAEESVSILGSYRPDGIYGWTKLTMEKALKAYLRQYKLKSSILRYTTVFGPRENTTHAIIALITRALKHEDPFLVWGDGNQGRDWIYVDDVVTGTLLAGEKIDNADPINLVGTEMISIKDLIGLVFNKIGWTPKEVVYDHSKPIGPKKRFISGKKAKKLLCFKPSVSFDEGLERTIKWVQTQLS